MNKNELLENDEKQKALQRYNSKIEDYIEGFTVHGLTRVFTTQKFEALFWLASLLCGAIMSAFVIYGLVSKYYERETYTEIKFSLTDKNYIPAITICDLRRLTKSYFSYCGVPNKPNMSAIPESFRNSPCNYSAIKKPERIDSFNGMNYWTNGFFNVTKCRTWEGESCLNTEEKNYIKSRPELNHSCFTLNHDGTLHDTYSHVSLEFSYHKQSDKDEDHDIIVIPHEANITEIELTKQVEIDPYKRYTLTMDKTLIIRLPAPYSKCTKAGFDILPGMYARRTCIESYDLLRTFKKCGDTTDYMREHVYNYLSHDEYNKYAKAKPFESMVNCIKNVTKRWKLKTHSCPFPCKELELGTVIAFKEFNKDSYEGDQNNKTLDYAIEIQLQNVDSYKIMEEKALYPWKQMACEIGGFLGLVMGASMLSMIEILACLYFYSAKKLKGN